MLVHCHKTLADIIDPAAIAKMFVSANEQRKEHACWKLQVNVDLLLIEGGGGGGLGREKKNAMSNFMLPRYAASSNMIIKYAENISPVS